MLVAENKLSITHHVSLCTKKRRPSGFQDSGDGGTSSALNKKTRTSAAVSGG